MDGTDIDALARRLCSRRTVLPGLLGGGVALLGRSGADEATAHKLAPACRRLPDPARRR